MKVILLSLLTAGIAAGSFYAGLKWNGENSAATGKSLTVQRGAESAPGGATKSPAITAATVSRSDSVLDFFKRYGLGSGVALTPEKMKEAISEAIRETDPVKSQMMFARLMEELTPENAPVALAMIRENVGGFESMRYMSMLAWAWGTVDAEAAIKEMGKTEMGRGPGRGMGMSTVLAGWASKDPQAAVRWLESYDGEGKDWMANFLLNGYVKSDPEGAAQYAAGLKEEGQRQRAAETLAREMIRTGGIARATEWVNSLTDPSMKRGAFDTVAEQLSRSDPEKAMAFIRQYQNEEFARGAAGDLAQTLGRDDPRQGLAFAASLTGQSQSRAYGEVIREWLRRDDGKEMTEASQYVQAMPAGENRDAASSAIARSVVRDDPQAAIAWANSIRNAETRQDALVDVARSFAREDPTAFAAWLPQSGLSAEAQAQLTRAGEGRREWFGGAGGGPGGDRGGRRGGGGGFDGGGRGGRGR